MKSTDSESTSILPLEGDAQADRAARAAKPLASRLSASGEGIALRVIALAAAIYLLRSGAQFFVPFALGIVLAYTLNPLVNRLQRLRMTRAVAVSLVMLAVVGGAGVIGITIEGQARSLVDELPQMAHRFSALVRGKPSDEPGAFEQVQSAANDLGRLSGQAAPPAPGPVVQHVIVDEPPIDLKELLWAGSFGVLGIVGQAAVVLLLAYFMLLSGSAFKRKLVKLTGPTLTSKKNTVQLLDEVDSAIQRYMLSMLVTNLMVAAATWAALYLIGLDNPGAWGVAAGVLRLIPYIGPLLIAVGVAAAGLVQSGHWPLMLYALGATVAVAAVIGMLVGTWMTGRLARINTTSVFVCLLFWTWIWGISGALLAVPLTCIVKVVCERTERFHMVAEILSD